MSFLLLFAVGCAKDDGGGANGEEGAVLDDTALTVAQNLIVHEGARIAWTVTEHILQFALFVAAHVDDAVVHVYAWVHGLDRAVDAAILHISADDVVAHLQWDDLLVCEYVLDDYDGTHAVLIGVLVQLLLLASFAELGYAHADAKLLVAIRANEHETLTSLILSLVEGDEIIAFRATYSFHKALIF